MKIDLTINGETYRFTKEELAEDNPTGLAKLFYLWAARAADAQLEADLAANAIEVWKAETTSGIARSSKNKLAEAPLKRRVIRDEKWKKLVDALARARHNAATATAIAEAIKLKAALVAGRKS